MTGQLTAVVTGGTRGFGRGITEALAKAGYTTVTVARGDDADVVADVAAPGVAERVLAEHAPAVLVLNAGAVPDIRPVHEQTWESFSAPWEVDVRQAFEWCRAALRGPLAPGSVVVLLSSGAALAGSPRSGGYAGAKAMVRFVARYADEEAARLGLGIRFVALLPGLSPGTGVGDAGADAYSAKQGISVEEFTARLGPVVTPEGAGAAVLAVLDDPGGAYKLSADGLEVLQ
ncbi:SDR family oxidoreductase [Dactylosporangium vinaceum]|uniref:SDR family NAD(P)-dependent oxidoreductase n=1 Tax=Dactylosporangium vinaceum TaxID=53362 RepID=A0ABV5MFN9_9ACTN|nr:SDR family NAD(P)-dependent oxidoreductase [Dactylosporangium vinaceum]UAB98795.1 SDR family oxidoreductase [Dactylosporangium vinaceum]